MKQLMVLVGILLMTATAVAAGPLRVYVGEFNAVGVAAKDDTRVMLQSLLSSRLNSDKLLTVSSAAEAEVLVGGTYVSIGKQYNLDAYAKTAAGQTVARTSVHGDGGHEALFGAVGSLAEKLANDLNKKVEAGSVPRVAPALSPAAVTQPAAAAQSAPRDSAIIKAGVVPAGEIQRAAQGDIIRAQAVYRGAPNQGEIKRLDGMYNLLAYGGTDESTGKRMVFIAQNQSVAALYLGDRQPFAGFSLKAHQKVVSLDYMDGDGNGQPELYVTVVSAGEVNSQVWELKNNKFVKLVDNVPYFFRALALAGGPFRLYAQEQGRGADQFYGDVYEVVRHGTKIIKKQKVDMPRYGNIYSFNQFKHQGGELLTVVYHENNYLIVYDKDQKELWRSNDPFGGSELFFQVKDIDNSRVTGDDYRWFFMNQRILVTSKQEVIVGRNDGFWVLGNARMYKKGAVYNFYWNGAALEEVWRTKDTQNYMPDFWFDEQKSELLLLQLTQREDTITREKGATALQIKKVE